MIDVKGLPVWGGLGEITTAPPAVVVAGIPYDGSATYRPGAAQAPGVIRQLSAIMPPLDERGRSFGELTLRDVGDLDLGLAVETGWPGVADRLTAAPPEAFLTVFGGDHCAAIPVLVAQVRRHPDLKVVWVDAHPDLCDISRGGRWTCGCALRRGIEESGLDPRRVVLVGCRDFDREEVAYAHEHGMVLVTAAELSAEPAASISRVLAATEGAPVHVSFDIDALDPAFAPGTEVPSAGGLTTREALHLLSELGRVGCPVGLDICEVSPPLDHEGITSLAALKLAFESWARIFVAPPPGHPRPVGPTP